MEIRLRTRLLPPKQVARDVHLTPLQNVSVLISQQDDSVLHFVLGWATKLSHINMASGCAVQAGEIIRIYIAHCLTLTQHIKTPLLVRHFKRRAGIGTIAQLRNQH